MVGEEGAPALVRGRLWSRMRDPYDWMCDVQLGIRTFGFFPASGQQGDARWYLHYQPALYRDIRAALRLAKAGPEDVFYDLGSGLGRAVFAAADHGVKRAVGVEYAAPVHDAALENLARCTLDRTRIAFVNADASTVDLGEATILYIFHSFGAATLSTVIDNARAARMGRPLKIIYYNPVCAEVLDAADWLRPVVRVPARPNRLGRSMSYDIAIYAG